MRKVKVFKLDSDFRKTEYFEGAFHEWGLSGGGSSIAIVEKCDGQIMIVDPQLIQFINKNPED